MKQLFFILLVLVASCKKPSSLETCQDNFKDMSVDVMVAYDSTGVSVQNIGTNRVLFHAMLFGDTSTSIVYYSADTLSSGENKSAAYSSFLYHKPSFNFQEYDSVKFWIYANTGTCQSKNQGKDFEFVPGFFLYKSFSYPLP